MHELSLCGAIIDAVAEHAGGRPVRRVGLRIGHFRQVVPETLRYCWRMRVEGTPYRDCRLDIDHVPATVTCRACGEETTLDQPVLRCGACGGQEVDLTAGNEFLIESIDVEPLAVDGEAV